MIQKQIGCLFFFVYCLGAGYAFSENNNSEPVSHPIVSKIIVNIEAAETDQTEELMEIANALIFIHEGEGFSPERLQDTLDALKLCKKFQKIHVDSSDGEDKITLTFQLTPFQQIKDILINDASPLFEREILNVMTIYIGDAFVASELSKQSELIEKKFKDEGFIAPKVVVSAKQDPEDGYFIIDVNIQRGTYYEVKSLDIIGNKNFSSKRLKLRIKTWLASLLPGGAGRFIEKNLKEDIKNLTEFYRSKKYADAVIDFTLGKDPETHHVSIFIKIDEGLRYDVEFEGNEEFWDWWTLKKDVVLFIQGNKNDMGIKKSIRKMKERYRNAGYLDAKIKIEEKIDKEEGERQIRFIIEEGPQTLVGSIQITGNQVFEDKKIQKQMLTQLPGVIADGAFVPEVLEEDTQAIESLYLQQGYLHTKVKQNVTLSEDKQKASVYIDIEEGIQTLVSSVSIKHNHIIEDQELLDALQIKADQAFQEDNLGEDEKTLASMIAEKGYPYIQVRSKAELSSDGSSVKVSYSVEEGPYVKMGKVYFTGNFRTKKRILMNELEVKPEAPLSLVKLLESQRNIRNLNTFDSVQFKTFGLKEKTDKINLFVEIEEKKPYFVEVGAGYDTERNFYAHAKSGDINLFGTNKSVWLGGEISQIGYRGEINMTEPRLLGSRISSNFGIFTEEKEELNQDFGLRTFGSSVGFSRKWFTHLNTSLGFSFEQREQFQTDTGEMVECLENDDECENRRIFEITPSINYDTRDSFIRPKKGIFSSLSFDISQGLENSLDNFLRYQLDLKYYWTPLERLTLAWHGRFGRIEPFGSTENVAKDQLFFLGGTSDVRGFKENMLCYDQEGTSAGGHTAILGSLEARFDLGFNFELATFYDIGSLNDTPSSNKKEAGDFRSSVGLGLRYTTPIGPIGFLYGFKLNREEDESAGRLHFSLGYTF